MADIENNYQNPTLDEIVFEDRNKAYGAYDLRRVAKSSLLKSFIIGTLSFLAIVLIPIIYINMKKNDKEDVNVKSVMIDLTEEEPIIEEPIKKEPEPEPEPPKEEEKVEVIKNVVPEPKKVVKNEFTPPKISEQVQTNVGVTPQEGVKKPDVRPTIPPPKPGTGTKPVVTETKPTIDPDAIQTVVDQEAEFSNGGENGFRRQIQENFDASVIEGEDGIISAMIEFVVERDGSITQVKVSGSNRDFNREAERTVRSIRGKWKPAKINGQPVRSRFKLPLKMQPPQ